MTFESGIVAFAERFLSERTHQLIVAPALADLQFAESARRFSRLSNRISVIRAVAGGLRDELASASVPFLLLTLVPIGYFLTLLVLCLDFSTSLTGATAAAALAIVCVLSVAPVLICFWPERRRVARID